VCVSPNSSKVRPRVFSQPTNIVQETVVTEAIPPSQSFRDELPLLSSEPASLVETEVYNTLQIKLPQSLYDEYAKTALLQDMSVEEVVQHRLAKCKNHNSLRGLWFSDSEHSQLENILKKRPLETAAQTLTLLSSTGIVNVDDLKITLTIPQRKVLSIRTRHGVTPIQVFEAMLRREFQV